MNTVTAPKNLFPTPLFLACLLALAIAYKIAGKATAEKPLPSFVTNNMQVVK